MQKLVTLSLSKWRKAGIRLYYRPASYFIFMAGNTRTAILRVSCLTIISRKTFV